jgi:hypothetical protein
VEALAAFVAALLAVAGGGAAVASGVCAILGRRGAVVGSGLTLGAGHLGLIWFQRVADRCTEVALSGRLVARLGRTISGVSRSIGLVEVVSCGHRGAKRSR